MTPFIKGLYDIKKINGKVNVSDGIILKATFIGKKDCVTVHKDGMTQNVTIKVKAIPNLKYNLVSALEAFENDFNISGSKKCMSFIKGTSR